MTAVPDPVRTEQLSTTVAWALESPMGPGQKDVTYALEGNITSTGAALEWTASILGVADVAGLERLAVSVVDSDGVTLVPAFAGLGAPYWDAGTATGIVVGLARSTTGGGHGKVPRSRPSHSRSVTFWMRFRSVLRAACCMPTVGAMRSDLLAGSGSRCHRPDGGPSPMNQISVQSGLPAGRSSSGLVARPRRVRPARVDVRHVRTGAGPGLGSLPSRVVRGGRSVARPVRDDGGADMKLTRYR